MKLSACRWISPNHAYTLIKGGGHCIWGERGKGIGVIEFGGERERGGQGEGENERSLNL